MPVKKVNNVMKNFQGFSLIEMAIVLIIIGFFLGGLLNLVQIEMAMVKKVKI